MKIRFNFKLVISMLIVVFYMADTFVRLDLIPPERNLFYSIILGFMVIGIILIGTRDQEKVFKFIVNKRYLIAIVTLAILVLFEIHGSSINKFNEIQPTTNIGNLFGVSRAVRSDEWMVQTPYFISQSHNGYGLFSDIVRATDTNMYLILGAPMYGVLAIGKLFNIGFLLLGPAKGLSFWWFGRYVALFLFSFETFKMFTKENDKLSFIGAIVITFSTSVTWWYSQTVVDQLIFGFACLTVARLFFRNSNKYLQFILPIVFWILMLNYVMTFYIPTLATYSYLFLTLLIFIIIWNKRKLTKLEVIGNVVGIVIMLAVTAYMIQVSREAIEIITSTVYPGKRVNNGGGGEFLYFFTDEIINTVFGYETGMNPSEYSSFNVLFPFPLALSICYLFVTKFRNKLVMVLTLLTIFFTLYIFVELPSFFATISLLSFTVEYRAKLVVELISVFLLILILADDTKPFKNYKVLVYLSLLTFIVPFIYYFREYVYYNELLDLPLKQSLIIAQLIILVCYIVAISRNLTFKSGHSLLLLVVMVYFIPSALAINPLVKGISVFEDKPVVGSVNALQSEDEGKWITYDSLELQQYLLALGVPTYNTVNVYPNFELHEILDEDRKYEEIYNRYAHIVFEITNEETSYELRSNDYFLIKVNVEDLRKLDVKYAFGSHEIGDGLMESAGYEIVYNEDGKYIYKLID